MNISNEEIEVEFERQVKLCSGIGKEKQSKILFKYWTPIEEKIEEKISDKICSSCIGLHQKCIAGIEDGCSMLSELNEYMLLKLDGLK